MDQKEEMNTMKDVRDNLNGQFDEDKLEDSLNKLELELINIRSLAEFLFDGFSDVRPDFDLVSGTDSKKVKGQVLISWSPEYLRIEPVDGELTFEFADKSLVVSERQTNDVLFKVG